MSAGPVAGTGSPVPVHGVAKLPVKISSGVGPVYTRCIVPGPDVPHDTAPAKFHPPPVKSPGCDLTDSPRSASFVSAKGGNSPISLC